ncbi:leucyl/phenylalanyl-tRNA--protein transferase [Agarivorans sp. MS3-6]
MVQPIIIEGNSPFPSPERALSEPNGLLAIGGSLSPDRLISAYSNGIFPWFSDHQPILWWSPDPRIGLNLEKHAISKSMLKFIKKTSLTVTLNHSFEQVIRHCAELRVDETWITQDMISAYLRLHHLGHAHSVEVWQEQKLVGGLYGVAAGSVFCGESMFHTVSNASKLAFHVFCRHFKHWGGDYIDGQVENPHLLSLGMQSLPRARFLRLLKDSQEKQIDKVCWQQQGLDLCAYL